MSLLHSLEDRDLVEIRAYIAEPHRNGNPKPVEFETWSSMEWTRFLDWCSERNAQRADKLFMRIQTAIFVTFDQVHELSKSAFAKNCTRAEYFSNVLFEKMENSDHALTLLVEFSWTVSEIVPVLKHKQFPLPAPEAIVKKVMDCRGGSSRRHQILVLLESTSSSFQEWYKVQAVLQSWSEKHKQRRQESHVALVNEVDLPFEYVLSRQIVLRKLDDLILAEARTLSHRIEPTK